MRIISYYVDKFGIMFQIIRTDTFVEIRKIITNEKEDSLRIGELVDKDAKLEIERIVEVLED